MKKQYKFLRLKGKKIVSESGNETWKLGEWKTCKDKLDMCNTGYHCSPTIYGAFSYIQGEVLAEVETKGKKLEDNTKTCNENMRLVKAWKWTKKDSLSLAIYAAEKVLHIFEKKYPNDKRPREAIEAAKKVLFKDTKKNRDAARDAAGAAGAAAWAAAGAAAFLKDIDKWMRNRVKELEEIK